LLKLQPKVSQQVPLLALQLQLPVKLLLVHGVPIQDWAVAPVKDHEASAAPEDEEEEGRRHQPQTGSF